MLVLVRSEVYDIVGEVISYRAIFCYAYINGDAMCLTVSYAEDDFTVVATSLFLFRSWEQ